MKTLRVIVGILIITIIFLVSLLVNKNHQIDYLKANIEVLHTSIHSCETDINSLSEELTKSNNTILELQDCLDTQTGTVKKLTNQLKYNFIPVYIKDTIPCDDVLYPYRSDTLSRDF